MSIRKKKNKGVITEVFEIMGLPLKFASEVTNDFISDTVSFIDPRRDKRRRGGVSTNY